MALQALQPSLQLVDILCGLVESIKLGKQGFKHSLEAGGLRFPPWPWPTQAHTQPIQLARRSGQTGGIGVPGWWGHIWR